MDKRLLTLLLVCMCATLGIQARTVKGTVVDKVNQPVIGASVHVNGTNLGAMTDVDGNFTISNAPDNAVLTFSYVGMVSKTVKAADGQMKIELADDVQNLEEVVVIGYGAAKAKDLTAPIEVVKGEKLIATPSSSPMTALQGKVAGVNIVNSGTPGDGPTVTIRGLGSFGNTTPLYVVDGMFYDNINFLNNADIQDLTIMKDASAAAIYGVRAANGVVIITTKKGAKNQDAKVTYNGYVGFQKATNVLEMCNSHEYATMLTEADKSAYSYMFENSIKNWGGNMNDRHRLVQRTPSHRYDYQPLSERDRRYSKDCLRCGYELLGSRRCNGRRKLLPSPQLPRFSRLRRNQLVEGGFQRSVQQRRPTRA